MLGPGIQLSARSGPRPSAAESIAVGCDLISFGAHPSIIAHLDTADHFGVLCFNCGGTDIRLTAEGGHGGLVFLSMSGAVTIHTDGSTRHTITTRNNIIIVPRGDTVSLSVGGAFKGVYFSIPDDYIRAVVAIGHDRGEIQVLARLGGRDQRIVQIADMILFEATKEPVGAKGMITSLARSLGVVVARHYTNLFAAERELVSAIAPFRLHRVKKFIAENLHTHISLTQLAEIAGLSEFHFARSFKRTVGVSPCRYVTEARINEARKILLGSTMTVGDVGARCGFNSQQHFTEVFRRVVGVPPARFRRMYAGPRDGARIEPALPVRI